MKTFTFLLALSLSGAAAFAQGMSMTGLTPALSFPSDINESETVTRQKTTHQR